MPWHTRPAALKIIKRLRAAPPERKFERDRHSRNFHDGQRDYVGFDVIALRSLFAKEFARVDGATPYNAEAVRALLDTSAEEVLAALFGDPNNLDWADTDRAARRTALAVEIDAALAERIAA